MHKTIRILLPALLLALCTACHEELTTTPATDNPLVLEHIYIGTPTKAEPIEWDGFREEDQLRAILIYQGDLHEGTYTYDGSQWVGNPSVYWQDPTQAHTLYLSTPEPDSDMPEAFTKDNWHTYDQVRYASDKTTPGTTSFNLEHTRAQLCITLEKGTGLTDEELAAATLTVNGTGMLYTKGAYYALIAPTITDLTHIVIDINGSTYTYNETILLTAGQCTLLTLTLHKTGVSGITTTGEDWQNVTGTVTEAEGWNTHTEGNIDPNTLTGKVLITGTLTADDMTTINAAKDQITHLYITAESDAWDNLELGHGEWDGTNNTLQSLYLPKATSVGAEAFRSSPNLTSISLPMAKTIGEKAFINDKSLTHISLPEATTLGKMCFADCYSLSSIKLPQATTIGWCAFGDCKSLTALSLPKVNIISDRAFQSCKALTTATLPKATNIGRWAFQNCDALTTICLPKDATIGESAFGGSDALTTLYISTEGATETDATAFVEKIPTLTTIHYGYHGTGNYLDPANYTGVYENN